MPDAAAGSDDPCPAYTCCGERMVVIETFEVCIRNAVGHHNRPESEKLIAHC